MCLSSYFFAFLRVYVKGKTLDTYFAPYPLAHSHCSVVMVMVVGNGGRWGWVLMVVMCSGDGGGR